MKERTFIQVRWQWLTDYNNNIWSSRIKSGALVRSMQIMTWWNTENFNRSPFITDSHLLVGRLAVYIQKISMRGESAGNRCTRSTFYRDRRTPTCVWRGKESEIYQVRDRIHTIRKAEETAGDKIGMSTAFLETFILEKKNVVWGVNLKNYLVD